MKALILILKLLGSAFIAFLGYFIAQATGWPGGLDAMMLERGVIGGAFMLLGGLCAVASVMPGPKKSSPAAGASMLFAEDASADPAPRPLWADEAVPVAAAEPEPAPEPAPGPFAEPVAIAPEPEAVEPEAVAETEPEIAPEPVMTETIAQAPTAHPASLASVKALLDQGDRHFNEGKMDDALDPYSEALDTARGLDRAAPSEETRELLACALKSVGDVHDEMGRLDPATEHYEEALGIRRAQLQAAPEDNGRKRALSLLLERLGDVRESRGHATRALDLYRTSLPIAQQLAASDPENPVFREDLEATKKRIAELEGHLSPIK